MTDIEVPLHAPLSLILHGYQLDRKVLMAISWAARMLSRSKRSAIRSQSLAESLITFLLPSMDAADPNSDLAAAVRERAEDFAAYHAANPQPDRSPLHG